MNFLKVGTSKFYHRYIRPKLPDALAEGTDSLTDGLSRLKRKSMMHVILMTVISFFLLFIQYYLIIIAAGLKVGFVEIISIQAATSLIILIPITIAGLGSREASLLLLMKPLGVTTEQALTYSAMVFLIVFVLNSILLGFLAFWIRPLRMGKNDLTNSSTK